MYLINPPMDYSKLPYGLVLAGLLAGLAGCATLESTPQSRRARLAAVTDWVCFYGGDRRVLDTPGAQLLVLDRNALGPLTPADKQGRLCLAYLSLGEVNVHRAFWDEIANASWVLQANPNWPDARLVDPRSPDWRDHVVREAGTLLAAGYDGLMLDTLDTVATLMAQDPARFAGVDAGMAAIIAALRQAYPRAIIVANRGFDLLPAMAPDIDGVLIEGVRSQYDFEQRKSRLLNAGDREWMDAQLAAVRQLGLPVLALDYVDPPDPAAATAVMQQLRDLGCIPCVSTVGLDTFPAAGTE